MYAVSCPTSCPVTYPLDAILSSGGAPATEHIMSWLKGGNSGTEKVDSTNGYSFTFSNCPPDYEYSDGSQDSSDGTPDWDGESYITTGWECHYFAPASGEPGHDELVAIDDGTFYTSGVPNDLDKAALEAISNNQFFFSERRGLIIYDTPLTGDDLTQINNYM